MRVGKIAVFVLFHMADYDTTCTHNMFGFEEGGVMEYLEWVGPLYRLYMLLVEKYMNFCGIDDREKISECFEMIQHLALLDLPSLSQFHRQHLPTNPNIFF